MKGKYEIIERGKVKEIHRKIFSEMLEKQGKVQGPFEAKADRCKILCIANHEDTPIAIGAIKPKTPSDFSIAKANVPQMEKQFEWELGYIYVEPAYKRNGIASETVTKLLGAYGNENLMASTEISENPGMVKILERNGFAIMGRHGKAKDMVTS